MDVFFLYFFKYFIYFSAFMVSLVRNPTYSVLSLILVFLGGAALFLFLGAEFLGFILVVVYVGAVAVLFLFVVMMLGVVETLESVFFFTRNRSQFFLYVAVLALFFLVFVYQFYSSLSLATAPAFEGQGLWTVLWDSQSNLEALGAMVYLYYSPIFLLCGLVLLVAMVGSIALTFSGSKVVKRQNVFDQVSRSPALTLALIFFNIHV